MGFLSAPSSKSYFLTDEALTFLNDCINATTMPFDLTVQNVHLSDEQLFLLQNTLQNPNLKNLDIGYNVLTDAAISCLIEAATSSRSNLQEINASYNSFSDNGYFFTISQRRQYTQGTSRQDRRSGANNNWPGKAGVRPCIQR